MRRHAAVFAGLAERAEPELLASSRRIWLDKLAVEHDNLRAALARSEAAGDFETSLRICAAAWRFWQQGGHLAEAAPRMERLLMLVAGSEASLSPALLSRAEEAAGGMAYWTRDGDIDRILEHYSRSLAYAQAVRDEVREAWAKYNLSFAYDYVPASRNTSLDRDRAAELRNEALEQFRQVGDRRGAAYVLWAMNGSPVAILERPERLIEGLGEALALFREVDDPYGETWALISSSMVYAITGRLEEARTAIRDASAIFVRDGDLAGQIVIIDSLAALAMAGGDPALAARLDAAGMAARRATGALTPPIPPLRNAIDAARSALEPADLAREEEAGTALTLEQVLAYSIDSPASRQAIVDVAHVANERSASGAGLPSEPQ
jgi:tetratricopeptide (TPR) repeat protein